LSSALPRSSRLNAFLFSARRWVVLSMLLALHLGLVAELGSLMQRIWLLVHFGLFLLWQPFFAAEQELERLSGLLLLVITGATIYFLPGWLIVAWVCVLLGIMGGKVFTLQAARRGRFYLVAFFYLAAVMLVWAVPRLVLSGEAVPEPVKFLLRWVLPLSLLALAFLPFDPRDDDTRQVFDFFYALLVFQLVLVLVLGSMALMQYTGGEYFRSALLTVIGFGAALIVLAVLWGPRAGYGGLRTYLSRYLLSVGMPFETWVRRVAELAESEADSQRFIGQALAEVATLPWIRGGSWKSADGEGGFGDRGGFASRFAFHELEITFHTEISLSPALFLHMRLLAQVISEFYEGKRREATLRRNAYLQAVHETGARLTHDIKNLLQSLYAITSAAPREGPADPDYSELLTRQLPQLTRRLQVTIDQLRAPQVETREINRPARAWWSGVERRHGGGDLEFACDVDAKTTVPAGLFDSFLENCLANARAKVLHGRELRMKAALTRGNGRPQLSFEDNGGAVPEQIARSLFREPIAHPQDASLGIGLFQVSKLAAQSGYAIELAANEDGRVVFRLRPG
jgi:hypothetical protein